MSTKENRKFITFYLPGSFFSEEVTQPVESFAIPKQIPRDAFAFAFSQYDVVIDGGKEFKGDTKFERAKHMIGRIVHADDIQPTKDNNILIGNIRNNSPTQEGVRTHLGTWQTKDEDTVIHAPSEFEFIEPLIWKNIQSEAA